MGTGDVSGIVLAGGRSSRFGSDKLRAAVDGRTMLARAVEAIAAVAADVVVVTAPGGPTAGTGAGLPDGVRLIQDATPFEGPLVGLLAGLREARAPLVLVVAGDQPWLVPEMLGLLVDELRGRAVEAAAFVVGGRVEPLPMALRRGPAREAVDRLMGVGERRLGALLGELDASRISEPRWRGLDPDGRTFLDVDRPDDLPSGRRPG
jgi:molybdopterin-guanine dinucleotide biosynthesis protein A